MSVMDQTIEITRVQEEMEEKPFDREEWLKQKKADREYAFRTIDQTAELAARGGHWLTIYLELQSRFPRYSVGNILLLAAQKPDAERLADFKTWKERGLSIRRGESGILILEPGSEYTREDGSRSMSYHTKRVFDISQTMAITERQPEIRRDIQTLLKALVHNAPCEIRSVDSTGELGGGPGAYYDSLSRTIYVETERAEERFFEIAKELAHAHMDGEGYERTACEFKAACAAYILCKRNHIRIDDSIVADPPKEFKCLDSRGVRKELAVIREVSNAIWTEMERSFERQKEAPSRGEAR